MREWSESLRFNGREDLVSELRGICENYSDIFDFVVLFGSTARGDCLDSSDIDLYIESDTLTTTKLLRDIKFDKFTLDIYSILGTKKMDYDLISKGKNEIKYSRNSSLYNQITKDGVILYDKRTKNV